MKKSRKTEITWPYTPENLFETLYTHNTTHYELKIEDGNATATLKSPQNPVSSTTRAEVQACVERILRVRSIQISLPFKLDSDRIIQSFEDGTSDTQVSIVGMSLIVRGGSLDVILKDKDGNITRDTKSERIHEQTDFLNRLTSKMATSPPLDAATSSLYAAVDDPKNALVHLYEVRDTFKKVFGTEKDAIRKLSFSTTKWSRLGKLSNILPLRQGRHRGKDVGKLRDATPDELREAREIALALIEAYLQYIT